MKKKIGLFGYIGLIAGTAAVAAIAFTGCANMSSQQQAVATGVIQIGVEDGVTAATAAVLNKNPGYQSDFALGAELLTELASGTNSISASAVAGTLDSAGETNPIVTTVVLQGVQNAATLLSAQTNAVVQQQQVAQVMGWVSTGINDGIQLHQALVTPSTVQAPPN